MKYFQGPIIENHLKRISYNEYSEKTINFIKKQKSKCVLIGGFWFSQLSVMMNKIVRDNIYEFNSFTENKVIVHDLINKKMALKYKEENIPIYYLTSQDITTYNLYHFNLNDLGAIELLP